MTLSPAPYRSGNLIAMIGADLRDQRRVKRRGQYPPGPPAIAHSLTFLGDPLGVLLSSYERYGPVFTLRTLHMLAVWVVGPEAQHAVLVTDAGKFHWREGMYRELIPLLGDGLISTDGEYHDRSRRLMLPVFHTERLAAATRTMVEEVDRSLDGWRPGQKIDAYGWAREIAMRVAMRALFGLDPDAAGAGATAREFERGLAFYGRELPMWLLRGPGTPFAQRRDARDRLARTVLAEISRRRREGADGDDILSLLMHAEDDDGWAFTDTHLLDHALTLLFAGHDTTTTTVALALCELSRHPDWRDRVCEELAPLGGRPPDQEELFSGLPVLEQVLDETLRLYPPVPAGMRRAIEDVEVAGTPIPAGAFVNYCPWAGHRLPDGFPEPDAFRPERMSREAKTALPKGAYVPFGGGKRICIGKRFGYLEAKVILSRVLQRFAPELIPGARVEVKWSATLVPKHGVPMRVSGRSGTSGSA